MRDTYSYFFCDKDIFIIEIEVYIMVSFVLHKEVDVPDVADNNSRSTCLSESTQIYMLERTDERIPFSNEASGFLSFPLQQFSSRSFQINSLHT
jgi:hypothetical protein